MKFDVTRDIVSDLWPLYDSGEASVDSKKLVEAYLAENGSFRAVLEESEKVQRGMPVIRLSPDAERRLIDNAHERARMKMWIIGSSIGIVGLLGLVSLGGALFALFAH